MPHLHPTITSQHLLFWSRWVFVTIIACLIGASLVSFIPIHYFVLPLLPPVLLISINLGNTYALRRVCRPMTCSWWFTSSLLVPFFGWLISLMVPLLMLGPYWQNNLITVAFWSVLFGMLQIHFLPTPSKFRMYWPLITTLSSMFGLGLAYLIAPLTMRFGPSEHIWWIIIPLSATFGIGFSAVSGAVLTTVLQQRIRDYDYDDYSSTNVTSVTMPPNGTFDIGLSAVSGMMRVKPLQQPIRHLEYADQAPAGTMKSYVWAVLRLSVVVFCCGVVFWWTEAADYEVLPERRPADFSLRYDYGGGWVKGESLELGEDRCIYYTQEQETICTITVQELDTLYQIVRDNRIDRLDITPIIWGLDAAYETVEVRAEGTMYTVRRHLNARLVYSDEVQQWERILAAIFTMRDAKTPNAQDKT